MASDLHSPFCKLSRHSCRAQRSEPWGFASTKEASSGTCCSQAAAAGAAAGIFPNGSIQAEIKSSVSDAALQSGFSMESTWNAVCLHDQRIIFQIGNQANQGSWSSWAAQGLQEYLKGFWGHVVSLEFAGTVSSFRAMGVVSVDLLWDTLILGVNC